MGKDPAFLFYSSDFLTGTANLTMQERGQYITLMCLQHQHGHLPEKTIWLSLGLGSVIEIPDVMSKFRKDENGFYYNERLEEEVQKRSKYTNSRALNGNKGGRPRKESGEKGNHMHNHMDNHMDNHMVNHMENENDNENRDVNGSEDKEKRLPYKDIVDYLNLKVGTAYKHSTDKTKELIQARFNEKFTLEDFKTVIDVKCAEWNGTDMQKFLRPETLFSNKFEGYLNQKRSDTGQAKAVSTGGSNYKLC